jgi:hypothetical protein
VAVTIKLLAAPDFKLVFLTGRVMEPFLRKLYPSLKTQAFQPKHSRHLGNRNPDMRSLPNLLSGNEFFCCSNYSSERLNTQPPEQSKPLPVGKE